VSKVRLREIERSDLATINGWRANRELAAQLGAPFRHVALTVDEKWYEQYLATRANNVRLAICVGDGAPVGAVYLLGIDWTIRAAEFAIWIGAAGAQGRGIGEAATRLMLDHAFNDLNLGRIYLTVLRDNERALGLYRKLGFVQEGVLRRAAFKAGRYHDMILMALLREEIHRASRKRL
jgi:RimJ/RimL family protein N-acetyltransferase